MNWQLRVFHFLKSLDDIELPTHIAFILQLDFSLGVHILRITRHIGMQHSDLRKRYLRAAQDLS